MSIRVRGASLAGLAAAARLARLGHDVELLTDGEPLGTRWAKLAGPADQLVSALPAIITLPATWRDLFKKSGAHLVTALNGAGLELVEAPPVEHRFADGSTLLLPTERGAQFRAMETTLGKPAATRWQALLDELDQLWATLRSCGIESPTTPNRTQRRQLWLQRSIADVLDRLANDRLAALVISQARQQGTANLTAPAVVLHQLVVERSFGRWLLVGQHGQVEPATRLIELLIQRLATLGVRISSSDGPALIDCTPYRSGSWLRPAPEPITPPIVEHLIVAETGWQEIHDHSAGLRLSWRLPSPVGSIETSYRYQRRAANRSSQPQARELTQSATIDPSQPAKPDLAWGLAPDSANSWLRRTPILDGQQLRASACSPAGAEPWAELASAALAVYAAHRRLTGQDASPSNRAFKYPRLPAASH